MRIAVAVEDGQVAPHFGHCPTYMIFEAENGTIRDQETVPNPGHRPGFLPKFLGDLGVNIIIAGGMGGRAVELFEEQGIGVVTGAAGSAVIAAKDYLEGTLESSGTACHAHMHRAECGD